MVKRAAVQASNPAETPGKRAAATAAAAAPGRQLQRSDSGTVTLDKDVFWFAAQVGAPGWTEGSGGRQGFTVRQEASVL